MEMCCCDNLLGMHKDVVAKHSLAGLEGAVVPKQSFHAGHKKVWIVEQYDTAIICIIITSRRRVVALYRCHVEVIWWCVLQPLEKLLGIS